MREAQEKLINIITSIEFKTKKLEVKIDIKNFKSSIDLLDSTLQDL